MRNSRYPPRYFEGHVEDPDEARRASTADALAGTGVVGSSSAGASSADQNAMMSEAEVAAAALRSVGNVEAVADEGHVDVEVVVGEENEGPYFPDIAEPPGKRATWAAYFLNSFQRPHPLFVKSVSLGWPLPTEYDRTEGELPAVLGTVETRWALFRDSCLWLRIVHQAPGNTSRELGFGRSQSFVDEETRFFILEGIIPRYKTFIRFVRLAFVFA